MTNPNKTTGYQLTSSELHQRQQHKIVNIPAPTVIAVGITDPANVGSIFRICDAVGCKEVWFVDSEPLSIQKIKKVSRSTNEKLPHHYLSMHEFLNLVSTLPPLVAIEITSQSTDIYNTTLDQNIAFVVGSERDGISEPMLSICSQAIHIPMLGINSSMNVAMALGVALYEWHRQYRTLK